MNCPESLESSNGVGLEGNTPNEVAQGAMQVACRTQPAFYPARRFSDNFIKATNVWNSVIGGLEMCFAGV